MRTYFGTFVIIITLLLGYSPKSGHGTNSKESDRPNIIFIMSDDHSYQAISSYGSVINIIPNIYLDENFWQV